MLVLSRKENERLIIGENIVVQVVRVSGGRVRLGIEAPPETSIRREELTRFTCGAQNRSGEIVECESHFQR